MKPTLNLSRIVTLCDWGLIQVDSKSPQIWIGATDERISGLFEFYDGEQIDFRVPWAKKQHDNKTRKRKGSKYTMPSSVLL